MRAQEISILLQVDGPISNPTREYTRERISESVRIMEWEYSQGGTYMQGGPITQRRKYPGDSSDDNRSHRGQRPLKEEGIQIGMEDHLIEGNILIGIEDLLEEEDILEEYPLDPLMVEDP